MPQTVDGTEMFTPEEVAEAVRTARTDAEQAGAAALRRARGLAALTAAGLAAPAAEALLALPTLADADFATPEAAEQALSALASTFPALFTPARDPAASLAPLGGVGGSPHPAGPAPDLASMSMEDYIAHRTKKG